MRNRITNDDYHDLKRSFENLLNFDFDVTKTKARPDVWLYSCEDVRRYLHTIYSFAEFCSDGGEKFNFFIDRFKDLFLKRGRWDIPNTGDPNEGTYQKLQQLKKIYEDCKKVFPRKQTMFDIQIGTARENIIVVALALGAILIPFL